MEQKIYEMINDAEMILIGIGEEFSPQYQSEKDEALTGDASISDGLEAYRKSHFYAQLPDDHETIQAYNRLREWIGAKPYFVVTMNTDDLIYRSNLEKDLIVAPCGSMQKMQCPEHIVDAAKIREVVLREAKCSDAVHAQQQAVCPVCGKPLAFHTIETEGYLEEGYLPQWTHYTKWLSCTLNRKLCVLELGVGFRFPQVIRFPFEKAAAYNQKACLIRVNSKLPQLPEELSERGVSIRKTPVQFLLEK